MNGHRTWSSALRYLGSLSALTMLALPLAGCGESAPDGSVVTGTEAVAEVSSELSHCVTIQRTGAALGAVVDSQIVTDPVDPSKASTNFGSLQVLNVGYVGTDYRQALYKFDLSGIPVGSVVTSADLSLRMLQSPGKADLNIHAVTAPWSESTVTWNSLGYAYDPSPAASAPTLGVTNNTPMSIDVTGLVGSWVSGAAANEGLLVDHPNAGRTTLGTSEAPSLAPRPKLTVCYDDPSCTDGVQNQGETGVDCGGPCAPCQVGVSGWYFANYPGSNGTFDPTQQYNGTVSCGTTCGALGMTAIGARFICNLDGVGSTEGCTAATDGQYGTANCGWMMENNVAQTQNGNTEECSSGIGNCVSSSCSEGVTYHAIECQCQGVPAATCSDGIQNQGETGLDCGGPCAACPVGNSGWYFANYPGSNGTFDPTQQYNGSVSCGTTCGALGMTAIGARFICNLDGVGSTEGCTAATDGQYGTANCGWMMENNVAQTQNGNTEECSSGIGSCVSSSCSESVTYHAIECQCQGVAAATCSDGIQNQGETGLDCGGPCAACPAPNAGWYFANYPGSNGTFDPTQQYNGTISCPTTCGALGLTATGARFICNLDGVGSTEGCTAATDGQYGTANCGWMMQSNVAQTQNGNTEECSSGIGSCVSSSCSEGVTYHAIECECQ